MGTVILTIKMLPDSAERDVEAWKPQIEKIVEGNGDVLKMEKEPVAFGLNALKVIFTLGDKEGVMDEVENALKAIEGVNDVSVTDMTRALE